MYEKLQVKIDELFENAPKNNRALELKEELMANLIDKYNDFIESGKEEDEAINLAVSSIGDVDELIRGLRQYDVFDSEQLRRDREKSALLVASAIGLYIISFVIFVLSSAVLNIRGEIALCLMLLIDALATGLIIYNIISCPKYIKEDNTVVEEFKKWKSANDKNKNIIQSLKSISWALIVAIYFFISFKFHIWAYSWIIFFLGVAVDRIITLVFELRRE